MAKHDDWHWLRAEVATALAGYEQLLASRQGSERVPNLEWNVAELTAHLASLPGLYRRQHALGTAFEPPPDWAAYSVEQRAHIDTDDLAAVSALLRSEVTGYLDDVEADATPDDQRWLYGCTTTARNITGAILTELIMHGQDLARLGGTPPTLNRDQAAAGLANTMSIVSAFVDPAKAAKIAGTYHMGFRGGAGDWTFDIDDHGALTVTEGRPPKADARLSADPAAFMLVSLGRINQFIPALKGQIVAYGRKPWKLLAVGNIAVDGV